MRTPADLEQNIEAYEAMRETLEKHHLHKFVVFHDAAFLDSFDTFHNAAGEAVHRFRHGPYLIDQSGTPRRMVTRKCEECDEGQRLQSSTPFTGLITGEERFEIMLRHPSPRLPLDRETPSPPKGLSRLLSHKPLREDSRPPSFHRKTLRAKAESWPRNTSSDFSCAGLPCNT